MIFILTAVTYLAANPKPSAILSDRISTVILKLASFHSLNMAFASNSKAAFFAAFLVLSACVLPAKADVRAVNQCPYALTVFYRSQAGQNQITLGPGTNAQLGLPSQWIGGVLWASQSGNTNNGQCTQLEINIAPPDAPTRDFYDISLVNAYNEPAMLNPTFLANGDSRNGLECGTPQCTISNINSVCQPDNVFAGPDNACINTDGPGIVNTPSIDLFRIACPEAYVQSNDNTNVVYACNTGSNYDAIWCP